MSATALPASGTPFLTARNLSKRFGALTALAGVDLDIRTGEVLALLGDIGAGKSTFITVLAGAHAPSGGEIRIEGKPVAFALPQDAAACGIATTSARRSPRWHAGTIPRSRPLVLHAA